MKVVAIAGGFDPVHKGHIRLIQEAARLGGKLVIILNNDNWLKKKKGFAFMAEDERAEVLRAIRGIDEVIITSHQENPADMSVCKEVEDLKPDIFANGGDRFADDIPEFKLCNKLGIKMVFNVGGKKAQSSSGLVKKVQNSS